MELRHLRYFVVLAKELNFRRAAEVLRVASPSLSKQIKDLEHELEALGRLVKLEQLVKPQVKPQEDRVRYSFC